LDVQYTHWQKRQYMMPWDKNALGSQIDRYTCGNKARGEAHHSHNSQTELHSEKW